MKIAIAFVLLGLISNVVSLSCYRCEKAWCQPPPHHCPAGYTTDVCYCCYVCAKGLGEKCGDSWGYAGKCGYGLECVDRPVCATPVHISSGMKKIGICLPKKDLKIMRQYCKYGELYCEKPKPSQREEPLLIA